VGHPERSGLSQSQWVILSAAKDLRDRTLVQDPSLRSEVVNLSKLGRYNRHLLISDQGLLIETGVCYCHLVERFTFSQDDGCRVNGGPVNSGAVDGCPAFSLF
jgi:hypothetical protein